MRVVVALCRNAQGEYLLAQRVANAHLAGTWEFPGGKVEVGESDADALARELDEELGVTCDHMEALLTRHFDYPDRSITLQAYTVLLSPDACARVIGREGQALQWLRPEAMASLATPAANAPLIAALRWPPCWAISPEASAAAVLDWAATRCQAATDVGLVLRLPHWPLAEYIALARSVAALCQRAGVPLLLHGDVRVCEQVAADGFHASSQQATTWQAQGLKKRDVLPATYALAVAAHSADELRCAEQVMADWAWLSPVQATQSHPEANGLGWVAWAALVQCTSLPVYGLGGLTPAAVHQARAHGGVGVAGIRGF